MSASKSKKEHPSLFRRYEKVIGVLLKYGFEDLVASGPLTRFKKAARMLVGERDGKSGLEYTRYERIRMVCEELGPTYIKFAQIASNRPDLLPDELLAELQKFQDNAYPVPEADILKVLHEAYDQPIEEIFEHFDPHPIAYASMAQGHRARLNGGKEVVLKVQRPGIELTIEEDIAILRNLAGIAERRFPHLSAFQPTELVNMFEKSIRKELLFTMEMANVRRFESNFLGNPDIYVPSVYPEYTTDKVLCMEYIHGIKITDLKALENIGISGPEMAIKGINLYFQQVFEYGFSMPTRIPATFLSSTIPRFASSTMA
ncbi:MAG: AarF/ABC1/UbiB kinase family protein [Lewinellaceae bacterium]|nr:AarF/ABC1/UbiB kinase family protein [Lewinellaceae bacterium]